MPRLPAKSRRCTDAPVAQENAAIRSAPVPVPISRHPCL